MAESGEGYTVSGKELLKSSATYMSLFSPKEYRRQRTLQQQEENAPKRRRQCVEQTVPVPSDSPVVSTDPFLEQLSDTPSFDGGMFEIFGAEDGVLDDIIKDLFGKGENGALAYNAFRDPC